MKHTLLLTATALLLCACANTATTYQQALDRSTACCGDLSSIAYAPLSVGKAVDVQLGTQPGKFASRLVGALGGQVPDGDNTVKPLAVREFTPPNGTPYKSYFQAFALPANAGTVNIQSWLSHLLLEKASLLKPQLLWLDAQYQPIATSTAAPAVVWGNDFFSGIHATLCCYRMGSSRAVLKTE